MLEFVSDFCYFATALSRTYPIGKVWLPRVTGMTDVTALGNGFFPA